MSDEQSYPTDEELKTIENWDCKDIESNWWMSD